MLGVYLRLVLFVAGLIGAVILFAFAFTAAAIVVVILLILAALFGRGPQVQWTVIRRTEAPRQPRGPVIEHDPNDLPRGES